jgi:hypothetical protein
VLLTFWDCNVSSRFNLLYLICWDVLGFMDLDVHFPPVWGSLLSFFNNKYLVTFLFALSRTPIMHLLVHLMVIHTSQKLYSFFLHSFFLLFLRLGNFRWALFELPNSFAWWCTVEVLYRIVRFSYCVLWVVLTVSFSLVMCCFPDFF